MAETSDYDPGPWKGHDFKSARAKYDVHVGRSYDDANAANVNAKDLVAANISTNCQSPLVIACDVTGSMKDWPAVIFSKLPYLDIEGKTYLGEDMEISFCAIGDADASRKDKYPLQVQPFAKGTDLEPSLKKLVIEGGGGGNETESYDLAALYYARNCEIPNATKPIFIFIGDEGVVEDINPDSARQWVRVTGERLTAHYVFGELKRKFSVYCIRKLYQESSGDTMSLTDQRMQANWVKLLGEDHVVILPQADRVVDVIFGILARETGKVDYFIDEITGRQTAVQVKTVMKSLDTIHKLPNKSLKKLPGPAAGKSVTRRSKAGKKEDEDSVSLL